MIRRARTSLASAVLVLVVLGAGAACADGADRRVGSSETAARADGATPAAASTEARRAEPTAFARPQPQFGPYEPAAEELYANGKRLAGRVAQELATFPAGARAADLAAGIVPAGQSAAALRRVVRPLRDAKRRSAGEVIYVQLAGVTATTFGAMVVVREHLEDAGGRRDVVDRVMDVRLRRTDGPWSLDRVASVGGTALPRPASLPAAAARVLDHPGIQLPDTARWDIYRGRIDNGLLRALGDAADRTRFAVTVLRTGHPPNVWATNRRSAHTAGLAADIYAVGDTLVIRQRTGAGPARRLAESFLTGGARQVGSPWILPPGGSRSFTDSVHQDHIHVQQSPFPQPRG